jgi:hypothetical protein
MSHANLSGEVMFSSSSDEQNHACQNDRLLKQLGGGMNISEQF